MANATVNGEVSRLAAYKAPAGPRIIAATEGDTGTGKTRFALSAPRPLSYFSLDRGFEDSQGGSAPKLDMRGVDLGDYSLDDIDSREAQDIANEALAIWNDLCRDWKRALLQGQIDKRTGKLTGVKYRTGVIDTGTEVYQLLRLARHGKVAAIPPIAYPDLYSEFRSKIVKPAFQSDCNVLFLHKLKDDRENKVINHKGRDVEVSIKTGNRVLDGFPDFRGGQNSYAVPTMLRHTRDLTLAVPDRYILNVVKCVANPELDGENLPGGIDFAGFASIVYPETMGTDYWS